MRLSVFNVQRLPHFAIRVLALALLLGTCACASRRPASILVDHQLASALVDRAEPGLSLKVVTFNIWGLPSCMTGARGGRYPKIARELERLDTDFILLQEAWTAKARTALPRGPWAVARAAGQHSFFQQSGLVTLSKFPILGGQFYPFTRAAFPDRFVNKGALKVSVLLPGGAVLNVWNVHLQDAGAVRVRGRQVQELLAHIESAQDGQIADLVAGDFNCTPDSPLYVELEDSLGFNLQKSAGAKPFVTWDKLSAKPGAGKTLDYMFLRPRRSLQVRETETLVTFTASNLKERLSDHLGLEATVSLEPTPALARVAKLELEPRRQRAVVVGTITKRN